MISDQNALFELPEQDVGIVNAGISLKGWLDLGVADQTDKYAPHFLRLKINKLQIWFSFEEPVAFAGRNGGAVLQGAGHQQDMHAFKAGNILHGDKKKYGNHKTMKSKPRFYKLLADEVKKEIIHTSSEVMSSTLGA